MEAYFQNIASRASRGSLAKYSDLILVAGVVAIVALMIIPLPTFLIDVLVAVNITFGIILLLTAIYISAILEFSVFPSVLLISTLFRLALSVATTRMILLQGDAGQIINTFGNSVAGGNLVVGLVVFLIITVVQFIVIAKGAERVAEVAARFSLDGMPGKQLSIDSDLRAGLIDKEEARRRRRELEQESKLHGSLDGAMKFVKGDAIASLVIIVINLLGGLAVGMGQQDLAFGSALEKYSILTIGDGLVAQIPALLSAMAAGLIVTRTTDEERHLGDAVTRQLSAKPRVLLVAGFICFGMALVPGFPTAVFIPLGLGAIAAGVALTPALRHRVEALAAPARARVTKKKAEKPAILAAPQPELKPVVPLLLELSPKRVEDTDSDTLTRACNEVMDELQLRLGILPPPLSLHFVPPPEDADWRLLAYETPLAGGTLPAGAPAAPALKDSLRRAMRRNLTQFIGIQETSALINRNSADYPDLVKEVLRGVPVSKLAEILRRLVEEEVPIRNFRALLEGVAEASQREKEAGPLAECARIALRRELNHRYAPDGRLCAVLLEPDLENELRQCAAQASSGAQHLPLDPAFAKGLIGSIAETVRESEAEVVLTTIDLRRHVRKLIEADLFEVAVLSYNELSPHLKLDIAGRIARPGGGTRQLAAAE